MASVSLAEPRRRQKWTLNPRGNLWANDQSKFGQKLMEKMGWEKGRGLGANQDGMVDHITLKHKDNTKGIGFQGHDDTWLAHQDDFQNVLAALNVEHGDAGKNMDEAEKKATLSEISKKSKRRVHYQKFVKGKDSSNYSADDLGCILGTKSDKLKGKSEPSSPQNASEEEDSVEENDKNFVQRGSYTDYFAAKMAALKAQGKFTDIPTWTEAKPNPRNLGLGAEKVDPKVDIKEGDCEEVTDEQGKVEKKKKEKKKKRAEAQNEIVTDELTVKVKKKSKKDRQEKMESEAEVTVSDVVNNEDFLIKKKKKSKKSKRSEEMEETCEEIKENTENEVTKKKKTKKSKKEKVMQEEKVEEDSGCENEENKSKKTKKGKKEKVKEKKPTYSDEEKENIKKNKRKIDHESLEVPKKKSKKKKNDAESTNTSSKTEPQIGFKGSNFLSIPGYGSSVNK